MVTTVTPSGISTDSVATSSFEVSFSSDFVSSSALDVAPFNKPEISSPLSPMIAKSSSTFVFSPSFTPICNKVPS